MKQQKVVFLRFCFGFWLLFLFDLFFLFSIFLIWSWQDEFIFPLCLCYFLFFKFSSLSFPLFFSASLSHHPLTITTSTSSNFQLLTTSAGNTLIRAKSVLFFASCNLYIHIQQEVSAKLYQMEKCVLISLKKSYEWSLKCEKVDFLGIKTVFHHDKIFWFKFFKYHLIEDT